MQDNTRKQKGTTVAVVLGLALGISGCDQHAVSRLVATTGAFAGDVVSILATRYLELALDVESGEVTEEHNHSHEHDGAPLHNHEH